MEKHEVDVLEFCQSKTRVDRGPSFIIADIDDLGGEEDLIAGNPRGMDGAATSRLVLVSRGRIDLRGY